MKINVKIIRSTLLIILLPLLINFLLLMSLINVRKGKQKKLRVLKHSDRTLV
jgi:hypothetical protein